MTLKLDTFVTVSVTADKLAAEHMNSRWPFMKTFKRSV